MGAAYRQLNPQARVLGIERDPDTAAIAEQRLDKVARVDVELDPLPFDEPDGFDCLVYGDVLQQLREPWTVLSRHVAALRPGGTVLLCVPNAEHWSLTARLFQGGWDYEAAGLLDADHLRWFSLRSVVRALQEAGLVVEETQPRIFAPDKARGFIQTMAPALQSLGIDGQEYGRRAAPLQYVIRAQRQVPAAIKEPPSTIDVIFRGSDAPVFFLPALMAGGANSGAVQMAPGNLRPVERPYACVVTIWDFWRLFPARCASAGVAHFSSVIEAAVLDDVRAERAVLLLDLTNEGPEFDRAAFDHVHAFVDSQMLPADRVIWLAQNRAIETAYHAAYRGQRPAIRFLYL